MLAIAGCGNDTHRVPVACLDANLPEALVKAPGHVTLQGTKLSECFTRAANPAEVQQVGAVFVAGAEQLAPAARARPHSAEALRLGYLIGAVRHGAGHTQGIHYEIQRRVELELNGVNTHSAEFVTGEKAGEKNG